MRDQGLMKHLTFGSRRRNLICILSMEVSAFGKKRNRDGGEGVNTGVAAGCGGLVLSRGRTPAARQMGASFDPGRRGLGLFHFGPRNGRTSLQRGWVS